MYRLQSFAAHCVLAFVHLSIHLSTIPHYMHTFSRAFSLARSFIHSLIFRWGFGYYMCLHVCNAIVWWCDLVASDDRRQLINARQQLIEHMLSLYQRTHKESESFIHYCVRRPFEFWNVTWLLPFGRVYLYIYPSTCSVFTETLLWVWHSIVVGLISFGYNKQYAYGAWMWFCLYTIHIIYM